MAQDQLKSQCGTTLYCTWYGILPISELPTEATVVCVRLQLVQVVIFWGQSGPHALICLFFVDYLLTFFTFCMFNFPVWVPESRSKDFHCKNMQQLQLLYYKYVCRQLNFSWIRSRLTTFFYFFDIKDFQLFLNFSNRWSNIHFPHKQKYIQQTKMLITCQRFGDFVLFGLVWQDS